MHALADNAVYIAFGTALEIIYCFKSHKVDLPPGVENISKKRVIKKKIKTLENLEIISGMGSYDFCDTGNNLYALLLGLLSFPGLLGV